MATTPPIGRIELKLRRVAQLFHTLDPSPFRDSDLAREAEDYIVGWAEDFPASAPIAIVIHIPPSEYARASEADIAAAVRGYFALQAHGVTRELKELFRTGRFALAVGLAVLSVCMLIAWYIAAGLKEGPLSQIIQESFVIIGWVAIWKPADVFLFEWPPIARRRALFRRLAAAEVSVRGDGPEDG
jgi:hypothetical protein